MYRSLFVALILIASLFLSSFTRAEINKNFYVGVDVARSELDGSEFSDDFDGAAIVIGKGIMPELGVEVGYRYFGEVTDKLDTGEAFAKRDLNALIAGVRIRLPAANQLAINFGVGFGRYEFTENRLLPPDEGKETFSEIGYYYRLGLAYEISNTLVLDVSYGQHFMPEGEDTLTMNSASLGLAFHF